MTSQSQYQNILVLKDKMEFTEKQTPVGVKIISIVFFVMSVLLMLIAVIYLVFPPQYLIEPNQKHFGPSPTSAQIILEITYQVVLPLAFGIWHLVTGIGLWKLKRWAKISGVIISTISVVLILSVVVKESINAYNSATYTAISIEYHQLIPILAVFLFYLITGLYLLLSKNLKEVTV